MATATPARAVGLTHIGRIAPGCDADLVALDEDFGLIDVWQKGRAGVRPEALKAPA
jgi:beta-aspartyl-dipeptidase (metallo-type)